MTPKDPTLFRARVTRDFRKFLDDEGFIELSTPVIRQYEGDILRPRIRLEDGRYLRESAAFALRCNLHLAGRIFDLGPCFRPDTVDSTHLDEFTMLDLYWRGAALADTESLAVKLVQMFYKGSFERLSFAGLIQQVFGIDLYNDSKAETHLHERLCENYRNPGGNYVEMLDRYITENINPLSMGRCLIVDSFPMGIEVRAKKRNGAGCVAERLEFLIDGIEVVHAYADEPDPAVLSSSAKKYNSFGPEDEIMCRLMEEGSVPAESSGFGIGLERFCQVCLGGSDIRDFIPSRLFSGHDPDSQRR